MALISGGADGSPPSATMRREEGFSPRCSCGLDMPFCGKVSAGSLGRGLTGSREARTFSEESQLASLSKLTSSGDTLPLVESGQFRQKAGDTSYKKFQKGCITSDVS